MFESTDEIQTFTCVVKNIPAKYYKENLVCKTYTRITVDGQQFVLYGEPEVGNIYDVAKALLKETTDYEIREILINIILDYDRVIGIPIDGLFE